MAQLSTFRFQLYVARDTQNSALALSNLNALCRKYLPDRHKIEVIDVFKEPLRALAKDIRMTPTLLKLAPSPALRIVGTLAHTGRVLQALGLDAAAV
jgi:circadian clock protein KaiB